MLCGLPVIVQLLSEVQRLLFEYSPAIKNRLASSAPHVFGGQVVQTFMISLRVVMSHKRAALSFQVTGKIIVVEENTILQRAMPAFDFALRHRVIGFATDVPQLVVLQPVLQLR